jgi:hypothetical protein
MHEAMVGDGFKYDTTSDKDTTQGAARGSPRVAFQIVLASSIHGDMSLDYIVPCDLHPGTPQLT